MKIIEALLNLIFPPTCAICGAYGDEIFCQKCAERIKYTGRAAEKFPGEFSFDSARSIVVYEGPIKEAIHKLKFRNKKALADPLIELVTIYLDKNCRAFDDAQLVLPVPLFGSREKGRGYNQSVFFANAVSGYLNIELNENVLVRVRNTKPQFELKRPDRFANVKDAFEIANGEIVKGKNIVLVDDILTTGATASECAKVLKSAGAGKVSVLTLARAIED